MSDDFWGGMFDFNGDGKTTWDEEMLGLAFLEEDCRRSEENLSKTPATYKKPKSKPLPKIKPVPDIVDDSNYAYFYSEYKTECICAVVALIIMLIPAIIILWAVYSTYDPQNSASDFVTIFFTIAGVGYVGVLLHTTGKSVTSSIEKLRLLKERYLKSNLQERKENVE